MDVVNSAISYEACGQCRESTVEARIPEKETHAPMSQASPVFRILCLSFLLTSLSWAQTESISYLIDTVAGSEVPRNAERAVDVWLWSPVGVATDGDGNVYVADTFHHRVLRISPDGTHETVAGNRNGLGGSSGDGGPATEARFRNPRGLTFGPDGSLYISDTSNRKVRKIAPDGIITTVAGSGDTGSSGDGGPATEATFNSPWDVAIDSMGNLYIADLFNQKVRKVDSEGIVSTFAGTGESGLMGDGGPASAAQISFPRGIAVGIASEVYIAGSRVRVVDTEGVISTFAGGGSSTENGPPTDYRLLRPADVDVDSTGAVYIANRDGQEILRSTADFIERIAGSGTVGFAGDGGPALEASFNAPEGIAVSEVGGEMTIYVADTDNHRIRAVTDGMIRAVAGTAHLAGDGGPATEALLFWPSDVALDEAGNLYIADRNNHVVRRLATDGTMTTVVGTGVRGTPAPGAPATESNLTEPQGVLVTSGGDLLISGTNNSQVIRVDEGGVVRAFAGTGSFGFDGDGGPAGEARLSSPVGLTEDSEGSVYIADSDGHRIRKVGPDLIINTVAGNGQRGTTGDGGAATEAALSFPSAVAVDQRGQVYVADRSNNRVRQVTPGGIIDTVAGGGTTNVGTDSVPALEASIRSPSGLTIDSGNGAPKGADSPADVLISSNFEIYRLAGDGIVRTIAGGGFGFGGDGGQALGAALNNPRGMAIDADGNIYVADMVNNRVRKLTPLVTRIGKGGVVNAGSSGFSTLVDIVSSDSIVSVFGVGLSFAIEGATTLPLPTELAGVIVEITDSQGVTRQAALFAVRASQINCLIPADTALGPATLTVHNGNGAASTTEIEVVAVAPGLFSLAGSGEGLAAATAFRRDADGADTPLPVFDAGQVPFQAVPIDLGSDTDLVVLSLFGTGIRGSQDLIEVTIGGESAQVLGFAPSVQFEGLDQVNVLIPRSLIGRGEVDVQMTVDGQTLNVVTITIL